MCHKKSPCPPPPPPRQNSDFRDTVNCTHRGPSTTQIRARGFHNDTSRRKHSQGTKHDPDPCQRFPQRYITKKTLTADQERPRCRLIWYSWAQSRSINQVYQDFYRDFYRDFLLLFTVNFIFKKSLSHEIKQW